MALSALALIGSRRSRNKIRCRAQVEWLKLGAAAEAAAEASELSEAAEPRLVEEMGSEVLELPVMPLNAVYLPSPSQQLMISEPRYLKLYDDILVNGSRMFAVCHCRGSLLARVGLVFRLTDLKDVAQETNGHTRYVAEHEVRQRVRILSVLNPEDQESKSQYLRAKVQFLEEPEEDTVPEELRAILQRIRGKLQDALAIQGEQEQGDPEELGNQARRLRLASVIRNPGFWDLCSMLGSIQSLRLQLEIRRLRQHVRQLTEDWAAEHPDEFEALKVNPKGLPASIRSQGERVRELMLDGSQELQETFQQILQAAQLTDAALLLEAAVDQELQRVRTVRSLNSLLRNQPTKE